jgi:hypothetical protein
MHFSLEIRTFSNTSAVFVYTISVAGDHPVGQGLQKSAEKPLFEKKKLIKSDFLIPGAERD